MPACELHPSNSAALRRARYTAVASRALVVTYAHGVSAGWRAVTPEFVTTQLAPFRREGFWLCGLAQCVHHLHMKQCVVVVAPLHEVHADGAAAGARQPAGGPTAYVDATPCDLSLTEWTLCGRWAGGAQLPTPSPRLAWWREPPLVANGTAGPRTACWVLPRGKGTVRVLTDDGGGQPSAAP